MLKRLWKNLKQRPRRRSALRRAALPLRLEVLEDRTMLSGTSFADPFLLPPTGALVQTLTATETKFYRLDLAAAAERGWCASRMRRSPASAAMAARRGSLFCAGSNR